MRHHTCVYLVKCAQRGLVHVNLGLCLRVLHAFPQRTSFPSFEVPLRSCDTRVTDGVTCFVHTPVMSVLPHECAAFSRLRPPTMLLSVSSR